MRNTTFKVAFCGFSPGFGYADRTAATPACAPPSPAPVLQYPRAAWRSCSRLLRGVPHRIPGGWHLLGTSTAALFDPCCDPPALLGPGTIVRFA